MIYDCFAFFNELDLLEIRLNTLNKVVDKFVLVEGTKSFTNKDKILYYEQNKERFKQFQDKIIHIIVDDFPQYDITLPMLFENYQRNAIARGLSNCVDDDIIMISDLDEIPNPEKVLEVKDLPGIKALDMNYFWGALNNLYVGFNWDSGTKILNYKDFKSILDKVHNYSEFCVESLNQGTTATKIRLYKKPYRQKHFHNAGWHFTFIGDLTARIKKLENYCEPAVINSMKSALEYAKYQQKEIEKNKNYAAINIDNSFPQYLYENQDKYKHLLKEPNTNNTLENLSKKSKPKDYLRLPIKLFIQLIPNKKLKGDVRNFLCQKAQINYL